ncbi:MAG: hypothetical protein Q4P71_09965 [Actinomycetaceae bacterium]|nr:hypothetical protein [Actinomycetaceae bacterium]
MLALFLFPMLALMGSAGMAPVAYAGTISPTLTDVVVSPSEPAAGTEVKMSLNWELPISAQSGDTFQIELPEMFEYSAIGGLIADRDNPSEAFMTVVGDGRIATFTVTDYAQQRIEETGKAPYGDFNAWFKISSKVEGDKDYDIILPGDGTPTRTLTITVKPADYGPEDVFADNYREAKKVGPGKHTPAGRRFYWEMTTPIGNSEVTLIDDLTDEMNTPGQEFICDPSLRTVSYLSAPEEWTFPPKYQNGEYIGGEAHPVRTPVPADKQDISCTSTKLVAKFTDIPNGSVVSLTVPVEIEDPEDSEIKAFTNFLIVEPHGKPIIRVEGKGYYKAETPNDASAEDQFAADNAKPIKQGIVGTNFGPDGTTTNTLTWRITTGIGIESATITDEFDNSALADEGKAIYFRCDKIKGLIRSVVDDEIQEVVVTDNQELFDYTCQSSKLVVDFKKLAPNEVGELQVQSEATRGFYWNTAGIETDQGSENVGGTAYLAFGSGGMGMIDPDAPPVTPPETPDEEETPPVTPPETPDEEETPPVTSPPSAETGDPAADALPRTGISAGFVILAGGLMVAGIILTSLRRFVD